MVYDAGEVHADDSRFLGDAHDRVFDLLVGHDQVGELVDHEDHVRQLLGQLGPFDVVGRLEDLPEFVLVKGVVGLDVPYSGLLEELVSLLHLAHRPFEDRGGLGHVGDHRAHEVGDLLELAHLDHLRVDQAELQLVRPLGVQPGHDDGVHAHALAAAGRSRDEHVRHLGEIRHHRIPGGVLAEEHRKDHVPAESGRHELLEPHFLSFGVGDLDADGALARHVWNDADVGCLQ